MSRLISRIRYRQFGVLVTTSYVHEQAYKEIMEDGHPILVVSATDIAGILRKNAITSNNIAEWLVSLDEADTRGTERRLKNIWVRILLVQNFPLTLSIKAKRTNRKRNSFPLRGIK